jgi:TM2 domain-containing membrane protein YozV
VFDWYYVGQYGQLGPLSEEQMIELIESGVVVPETYVWKRGMNDWVRADSITAFRSLLVPNLPTPPPAPHAETTRTHQSIPQMDPVSKYAMQSYYSQGSLGHHGLVSPSSRVLAGILQIFLPGVGRMYLGYTAIGVLQLVLTLCTFGMLWLWPFIDGILILAGTVKYDGYGRLLRD